MPIACWSLLFLLCIHSVTSELCGLTALFNPLGHATKSLNYLRARSRSRLQGLKLVLVELVYGNEGLQDEDDPQTIHVRIRAEDGGASLAVLWQKEALLNVALDVVVRDEMGWKCTNVVWIDADVVLQNGWIEEVEEVLEEYAVVQAFTDLVRLPQGTFNPETYWSEATARRMGRGVGERQMWHSYARKSAGYTGFAWAARVENLKRVRFYDKAIVGGFDALFAHALMTPRCEARFNTAMRDDFEVWAELCRKHLSTMSPNGLVVGYPQTRIIRGAAFWHGNLKDRAYQDRHQILLDNDFDPTNDVVLTPQGYLQFTANANKSLIRNVYKMFVDRREQGVSSASASEL